MQSLSERGIIVEQGLSATTKPGKYRAHLQEINRGLLRQAGILSSHIEVTSLCTSCQVEQFFSYRAEGGTTGRMAAWIAITA